MPKKRRGRQTSIYFDEDVLRQMDKLCVNRSKLVNRLLKDWMKGMR